MRLLSQAINLLALQVRLRNPQLAWQLHKCAGQRSNFCRVNGAVILRDTGLAVDAANVPLLASAGSMMRSLASDASVCWQPLPSSGFEARLNGLSLHIATWEDVFILKEIFGTGVYDLTYPHSSIVIDIGANIGAAALFFATKPWVKHVYAFEPLKPTAALARANFERNANYRSKITLFEYGLGAKDEEITVEYSPEWKANVGRHGLPENHPKTIRPWNERALLKEASRSLAEIIRLASDDAVVVKMDCEGGEWEILPNLAASGVLRQLNQMVIEWHHKAPGPLEELLISNGFTVVCQHLPCNTPVGLIYATRIGNRS